MAKLTDDLEDAAEKIDGLLAGAPISKSLRRCLIQLERDRRRVEAEMRGMAQAVAEGFMARPPR